MSTEICLRRQNAPINENISRTEVKNLFPFQLLFALWLFQHWFAGVTKIRTEAFLGVVRPNMALSLMMLICSAPP